MAASNTVASRLAVLVVLAPFVVVMWFAAPYFLPVWRWQNVDFEALARTTGIGKGDLERQYEVVFRHSERGPQDPVAWQLLEMKPMWKDGEEDKMAVRATIVSDRTGEPISALSLGSGSYKDRYFKAQAWRVYPGGLGVPPHRPVIIFEHQTMTKVSIGEAMGWEDGVGSQKSPKWPNDDDAVEDGYTPPETP
jgi:hypothetical protein